MELKMSMESQEVFSFISPLSITLRIRMLCSGGWIRLTFQTFYLSGDSSKYVPALHRQNRSQTKKQYSVWDSFQIGTAVLTFVCHGTEYESVGNNSTAAYVPINIEFTMVDLFTVWTSSTVGDVSVSTKWITCVKLFSYLYSVASYQTSLWQTCLRSGQPANAFCIQPPHEPDHRYHKTPFHSNDDLSSAEKATSLTALTSAHFCCIGISFSPDTATVDNGSKCIRLVFCR